mmetsp:Transcript_38848/g.78401  ORF Transcript_38848/g.78401 Transcript_38848/m.78401 type:complete len:204 (+) Transcript_38848:107-718(+)
MAQQRSAAEELQANALAGLQAGWAVVQEKAQAGYSAAKERADIARAGKQLLDRGGYSAEQAIRAKTASQEAAAQDAAAAGSIAAAVAALEEASARLRRSSQASEGLPDDIGGMQDFAELAEAYEARARLYAQLLEGLTRLPKAPELSAVEQDAAMLLQLKDGCGLAAQRAVDGCRALQKKAKEVHDTQAIADATGRCGKSPCM